MAVDKREMALANALKYGADEVDRPGSAYLDKALGRQSEKGGCAGRANLVY